MTTTEPRIILEGISINDFFARLEKIQPAQVVTEGDENMTVDQAALFLKLSVPTLHRLKARNQIPFTKVGARVIYRRSQLIAWLNKKAAQ